MPDCGAFRIGVDISEPKTPPLVMVKVPPCMSAIASLPSRARLAEVGDLLLDVGERHAGRQLRITGHDQALFGADGDADVVIVLVERYRCRRSRR